MKDYVPICGAWGGLIGDIGAGVIIIPTLISTKLEIVPSYLALLILGYIFSSAIVGSLIGAGCGWIINKIEERA